MEKRNSLDVKNSLIAEEQNEEREKKKVEDTVQKWLSLQKTVKEEITLEENIISQQTEDFNKLKNYFNDFYELKISSRKIYEDIRRLKTSEEKKSNDKNKDNKEDNKEETDEGNNVYYIDSTIDKAIFQAWEPIRNLLFLFRNNYDYITQLISLIDDGDEKEEIESLVELFCNQFYDNILIPNPEQEELLILIYKLLESEISQMNSASTDEFMHDSTFLGKFISSFTKKQELNVFLSILLNPVISSIENNDEKCLDMSLFSIQKFVQKKKDDNSNNNNKKEFFLKSDEDKIAVKNFLLNNIPKTTIHFKQSRQIEEEKAEQNRRANFSMETPETVGETSADIEVSGDKLNLKNKDSDSKIDDDKDKINNEYLDMLTQDRINQIIKKIKDNDDLKAFYEHQLEQINNDPEIFSNNGLLSVLDEQIFENARFKIID